MQPVAPHDEAPRVRHPVREPHRHPTFALFLRLLHPDELVPEDDRDAARPRLLDERADERGAQHAGEVVPRARPEQRGRGGLETRPGELARMAGERGVVRARGDGARGDLRDEPWDEVEHFQAVRLEAVSVAPREGGEQWLASVDVYRDGRGA